MATKISDMTLDTSLLGTESVPILDTTNKRTTVTAIAAHAIDVLLDAKDETPATGDWLLGFRSTDEKSFELDDVSTYAVDYVFGSVSEADPTVTGDMLIVDRSGTQYKMDVDTLMAYVLSGIQADVLDLSGLDAATLANTDLMVVCQTTTPKKTTISSLETLLWTDFATYVAARSENTSVVDSDKFYTIQGGTPKYLDADTLAAYMSAEIITIGDVQDAALDELDTYLAALSAVSAPADADLLYCTQSGTAKKLSLTTLAGYVWDASLELPWRLVDSGKYTALPASTSQITMSDTSDFQIGFPVKYVYGGVTYYGLVTALSANAQITVAGAALDTGVALTDLYVGTPERVVTKSYFVDDTFGDAVQDILSHNSRYDRWENGPARLVTFSATLGTADTGAAQPKLNVKIATAAVSTNDTNKGIQLSGTPGTWTANSAVAVNTTNYEVDRGDAIEIACTEAGTNGDADLLSANLTFVYE